MEPTLTENNTFQNFDSFYFQMQMFLIRNLNKITKKLYLFPEKHKTYMRSSVK